MFLGKAIVAVLPPPLHKDRPGVPMMHQTQTSATAPDEHRRLSCLSKPAAHVVLPAQMRNKGTASWQKQARSGAAAPALTVIMTQPKTPSQDLPPEDAGCPPGTATPRTGAIGQRPPQHAQVLDCNGAAGICAGQVVPSRQHLQGTSASVKSLLARWHG